MKKRNTIPKVENNRQYIAMRRDAMLSMGFCSECSNFNDLFPTKCCSGCKQRKSDNHAYKKRRDNVREIRKVI